MSLIMWWHDQVVTDRARSNEQTLPNLAVTLCASAHAVRAARAVRAVHAVSASDEVQVVSL